MRCEARPGATLPLIPAPSSLPRPQFQTEHHWLWGQLSKRSPSLVFLPSVFHTAASAAFQKYKYDHTYSLLKNLQWLLPSLSGHSRPSASDANLPFLSVLSLPFPQPTHHTACPPSSLWSKPAAFQFYIVTYDTLYIQVHKVSHVIYSELLFSGSVAGLLN